MVQITSPNALNEGGGTGGASNVNIGVVKTEFISDEGGNIIHNEEKEIEYITPGGPRPVRPVSSNQQVGEQNDSEGDNVDDSEEHGSADNNGVFKHKQRVYQPPSGMDSSLVEMIETSVIQRNIGVKWDDIASLDTVKKTLREIVILPTIIQRVIIIRSWMIIIVIVMVMVMVMVILIFWKMID